MPIRNYRRSPERTRMSHGEFGSGFTTASSTWFNTIVESLPTAIIVFRNHQLGTRTRRRSSWVNGFARNTAPS